LKVLHLTNYFFPEYSGTTTRLYNLISRLPFPVELLTSDRLVKGEKIVQKEEQLGNIAVKRRPLSIGAPGQGNSAWGSFNTVRQDKKMLAAAALSREFDILHAHNSVVFGQAAALAAAKANRPFILEYHGLSHETAAGAFKAIKSYYIQRVDKSAMKQSSHVITLTEQLKKWLADNYHVPSEKITVVPNGADTERFKPSPENDDKASELKRALGISGKVVMYAGIMDTINGLDDLATVIPRFLSENPDVSFVFVGGPTNNKNLSELTTSHPASVRIINAVRYEDMPAYYAMSDVFIIPRPSTISSETIVPLKLLEVMAMGKTVLASDVGGLAEVIRDGENGYLFRKSDMLSLKTKLHQALAADNSKIQAGARNTIIAKYTWKKAVESLLNVYNRLVT
jgi:glycosyltransferase involved in cell wall biosynthesis